MPQNGSDQPTASPPALPAPPRAEKRPHVICHHGIEIHDDYAWLRDPAYPTVDDPEILGYLRAENEYYDSVMDPLKSRTEAIFKELKGRISEEDESVPVKDGDWLYQWRFEAGSQYRRWYRKAADPASTQKDWQCILDEPALAAGHDYFRLGGFMVSPDGSKLAYAIDRDGSERFQLVIRDIDSGSDLPDRIDNTIGAPVWSADSRHLLYRLVNENWRPFCVKAHLVGDDPAQDRVLYEESDGGFFVHLDKTQSRQWIVISSGSHETSEVRLLPADDISAKPRLVAARETGHEYELDHGGGRFFIRSNKDAPNFRIFSAGIDDLTPKGWQEILPAHDRDYYRGLVAFGSFLAIEQRRDGLDQIRIISHDGGHDHFIDFPETLYCADLGANAEPDPDTIRISYSSMITPATVFDYALETRQLISRKVQSLPSGYDHTDYQTERLMAPSRDGKLIPISIVYKKGFREIAPGPVHLYGYGAYGMGMTPSFSSARLSLLDRGFAYAIAHIRGGDELGRLWYEGGKMHQRHHVFEDFIDAAHFLIKKGYAKAGGISASGGSAGGKLMGAIANLEPDLWRAIIAHVPFVDVLNTMLDASLPLTPIEWPEWGNPAIDAEVFRTIQSYSPYDNVKAQAYPPMMITCGLNDPRVTYWEPAKWVARLRALKTDDQPLILKTNMGAGHGGKSGRYDALYEIAEEYSFILMTFGLKAFDEAD
ncbi:MULTISPECIES: S9 family peptidase [unclassified Iodidimonas]|jgi:oligopeptidase B|uniref:S9 family peptidase n=1 Tax=unclassified Iodidimonas TaxID=2626145 RepID=UPI002482C5AA|nr:MULTISPECIES: S9 family peptidase [unclassified Iodidimonas]